MISVGLRADVERQMRQDDEALLISSVKQHDWLTGRYRRAWVMRDSEQRYRTLFDVCPAAVYSCDSSGLIQKFNRRAMELWDVVPRSEDTLEWFCGLFKCSVPMVPRLMISALMAYVLSGEISGGL